jgi:hypothetical protein
MLNRRMAEYCEEGQENIEQGDSIILGWKTVCNIGKEDGNDAIMGS